MISSRERFLAACRREPVDRPPVWLMRQAGRYLPEYQDVRRTRGFWDVVRAPSLAAEVTLQPLRRFQMDAAIIFSDILIVLDAMGVEVTYRPGGPLITPLVREELDLTRLREVNPARDFAYLARAIEQVTHELHPEKAVLGFAGAPFTLAAYLVEGGAGKNVSQLKALAYNKPELYATLASRIAEVVAGLLALQIDAGVDAVQIFDTWAGHLSPEDYETLALPYVRTIVSRLASRGTPLILYLRNAAGHLEAAARSGVDVISLDHSISLAEAVRRVGDKVALQGNLDPAELAGPPERIARRVGEMIAATQGTGHIVNLGQGLTPDTPIEGVAAFVEAVRRWSPAMARAAS